MRKVDDGEKGKRKKEKMMSFKVATNVVASRPPECRPTGTPTARAKIAFFDNSIFFSQESFKSFWWLVVGG